MAEVKTNPNAKRAQRRDKTMGRILVVIALVLLVGSGGAWWQIVRNDPQNTFNNMLENNLRTASVTRTVHQNTGLRQLDQVMRIQNRTEHLSHGTTSVRQGQSGGTVIVTESLGTPGADYLKYVSVDTTQKGKKGQALNFDNVLNVWSKSEVASESQLGTLYQDTTLGNLFLFADLPATQRNELIKIIKDNKVYEVDYSSVKKSTVDGRPKYTYKVNIDPAAYITMIKAFGSDIGLTQLQNLDPKNYENAEPLKFNVTVDVISQRVDRAKSDNGGTEQIFSGYGVIENVKLPTDTIPTEEFQQRLSQSAGV